MHAPLLPTWRRDLDRSYRYYYPRAPPRYPETSLARRATRHPECWPILLNWALRSVLIRSPPHEFGKRHSMRLAICQQVSSSFSPPIARGGEVSGPASYTTQSSPLVVPSPEVDVRARQCRHPGLAFYRERAY
jgi:hypothetical protein